MAALTSATLIESGQEGWRLMEIFSAPFTVPVEVEFVPMDFNLSLQNRARCLLNEKRDPPVRLRKVGVCPNSEDG